MSLILHNSGDGHVFFLYKWNKEWNKKEQKNQKIQDLYCHAAKDYLFFYDN